MPVPASAPPLEAPSPATRRARIPVRLCCCNPNAAAGDRPGAHAAPHSLRCLSRETELFTPHQLSRECPPSAQAATHLSLARVARPQPAPSRSSRPAPVLIVCAPVLDAQSLSYLHGAFSSHAPDGVGNRHRHMPPTPSCVSTPSSGSWYDPVSPRIILRRAQGCQSKPRRPPPARCRCVLPVKPTLLTQPTLSPVMRVPCAAR